MNIIVKTLKKIYSKTDQKINESISNQLTVSFFGMLLIIITVISIFVYMGIINILKNKTQKDNIKQFAQYEYNIKTFCSEIDFITRQLAVDDDLQDLINYTDLSESDRVVAAADSFKKMSRLISDFQYIDSIIFYSSQGMCLKSTQQRNEVYFGDDIKDRFYERELSSVRASDRLNFTWFGGYTDEDFNLSKDSPVRAATGPHFYLTAARGLVSGNSWGSIVVNINLQYFTSIYDHYGDVENNEMYVIADNGVVISHPDQTNIGKVKQTYRKMDEGNKIQVFNVSAANGSQKQAVYYTLGISGWILVVEVPMSVIKRDISYLSYIILIMFIVSIIFAGVLSRYWINKITQPLKQITRALGKMEKGSLGQTLDISAKNEVGLLGAQFNSMSISIKELILQQAINEEQKRKLEMEALKGQINPHFIYNTLNTISWMAKLRNADSVSLAINTLSDLLQPVFRKKDAICSLEDEITYIWNYVKLMNYRFANGFKIEFHIPEEFMGLQILRFILQPVVENSITHGFANSNGGTIEIGVSRADQDILIKITDNGRGMSKEKVKEINESLAEGKDENNDSGIGLKNVNRRVRLHYGRSYGIRVQSELGLGTSVFISMPFVLQRKLHF